MSGTDVCLVKCSSVPCAAPENDTRDTSPLLFWIRNKCDITFHGDDSLSYFANGKSLCWFLESKLEEQIKRLHSVVGNAIVDDHYIVVGTGSSQLVQDALYALSPSDQPEPISVVSYTPFYLAYPDVTLFKDGPYIELITSPNNPDGIIREPVIGKIGVSKEAQLRAAKILEVVSNSCLDFTLENLFEYSQSLMTDKWQRLRKVVMDNDLFVLQNYPPQYCLFTKDLCESHLVITKILQREEGDCEKLLKEHTIQTRSGRRFGSDSRNVRISMLSSDEDFNIFLKRSYGYSRIYK
ncbi:hypothetical protein H5410_003597 [Solanum commersonii]|uniref:Alliinase C-terminal domain-containing protein n=1 Tax=Solanum commersonii TaxID=4109 RepID=A0A9J6B5G4_SOLCO|nr:hypothetical protein H5410_003597 [Solanum commersonii]